jgi:hypothetical protein
MNTLLTKWNDEIFSHHNKTITNAADEEGETIALVDDTEEIARDMDGLRLGDALDSDGNLDEIVNIIFSIF